MSQETNSIVGLMALSIVFGIFIFGFGFVAGWNLRDRQIGGERDQSI